MGLQSTAFVCSLREETNKESWGLVKIGKLRTDLPFIGARCPGLSDEQTALWVT